MPRTIAFLSTTRSDFSLLYWSAKTCSEDPNFQVAIFAASHSIPAEEARDIQNIIPIEFAPTGKSPTDSFTEAMTLAADFAKKLSGLKPDLLVMVGDRYEILPCALAAVLQNIPIAHIHGGEITEGAIDDSIRNAMSKLANHHLVTHPTHRERLIQMGERPEKIRVLGAPGIENTLKRCQVTAANWLEKFGFPLPKPYILVAYHPVTREPLATQGELREIVSALDDLAGYSILVSRPNADPGSDEIWRQLSDWASRNSRVLLLESLGPTYFPYVMRNASVLVGNSSAGIFESTVAGLPVVDIGSRQRGRIAGTNVIRCSGDKASILASVRKALTPEFVALAISSESPYGAGDFSKRFLEWARTV